jgi:hypothetical protein
MTRTILKCRGEHLDWILYFTMLKQTNIRSLYVSPGDVIISKVSEFVSEFGHVSEL